MRVFMCGGLLFMGLVMTLPTGCATDDRPTANGGGGAGGRVIKASPSFSADIQEIFNRRGCTNSSCHGLSAGGSLDLRAGTSYGELVNVQSDHPSTPLFRVRPGHAQDSSYLVDILDGTGPGTRMPQSDTPLDSIDMQNIINWIHLGAFDN